MACFLFYIISVQSVFWVDAANFTPWIVFKIMILQNAEHFSPSATKHVCNFRYEKSTTDICIVKVCGETPGMASLPYMPVKCLAYGK